MKVLMIGWELPPHMTGGLGEACYGLAKAISKRDVDITFCLPRKVDVDANFMSVVFANIKDSDKLIESTYDTFNLFERITGYSNFSPSSYVEGSLLYAEEMKNLVAKLNFDVIHAHDWLSFPAGMMAKELTGKPLVIHLHATEYDRTGGHYPNPAVFAIEKEAVKKADKIITVSGFTKSVLVDKYGADAKKIEVVYNGIEYSGKKELNKALLSLKELGYKIVLYHGRITLQKGPEYFVRAAKIVADFDDKVVFVVSGSGDMQDFMIKEVEQNKLTDKFIFTGALWGDDRDSIIQSADVYVMPSVSEPFGIVPLEVVANETPTIISKTSGVSEVLNNALKVDFWDTKEIANKIISVISHKALSNTLVTESRKELPNISWDKSAGKCVNVYCSLLNNPGVSSSVGRN